MPSQKQPRARLMRLVRILKVFAEKERVFTSSLSHSLNTSQRTIQRDLALLKQAGFALRETGRGCYQAERDLLKNYEAFDDVELALIVALKNTVGQLGAPFQKAAADLFNRLYQATGESPVFVKIDGSVPLDGRLFSRIVRAIQARKEICFDYSVYSPYQVRAEPYRIVHFDGFWYVVARDKTSGVIKRYALDKIKDFKTLGKCFKCVPLDLDRTLEESANIWFSGKRHIELLVEVDSSCGQYFKRRRMFPTQEIREERPDGSLLVSFRVGYFEEIETLLKVWLPHIRVLAPREFRKKLLEEMKKWVLSEEAKEREENVSSEITP